ncbi:hypothetical protein [Haloechinothrix salitolerans]|uniref:Uncharacterized protein n=1 Tax=Haloechinothrix salitolerans TaxID=926830 RepID=A0ABW2BU51_9PSEU
MSLYGSEVVGAHWPMDGPHTPERIEAAGVALEELARYLNHATMPRKSLLTDAPRGAGLLGSLATAARRQVQLCRQLEAMAHRVAGDPTVRHDRDRDDAERSRLLAVSAAEEAEGELGFAAEFTAELAQCLDGAQRQMASLFHARPGGGLP